MPWPPTLNVEWDELRDQTSIDTWSDAVSAILSQHGLPVVPPEMFPTGSDVVMRSGEHVVKLSAPKWRAELEAEAENLSRVAGRLPVATPEVVATGELDGWPYVVMRFVPGTPLVEVWPTLDTRDRRRLAAELGRLLASLAAIPGAEARAAEWSSFLEEMRAGVVARHTARAVSRRYPDHPATDWLPRIETFLDANPLSVRPLVWLHTEVLGDHVFVDSRAGHWSLSAMIDFADGRAGHPFYEIPAIVEFLFHGETPLLQELLLAAGLSPSELTASLSRELLCWSLLHRFSSLPRMLHAAGDPQPESLESLAERLYGNGGGGREARGEGDVPTARNTLAATTAPAPRA